MKDYYLKKSTLREDVLSIPPVGQASDRVTQISPTGGEICAE